MYQSLENVWSLLFMTGYLTQRGRVDAKRYKLAISNLEIRDIFETQIMEYFYETMQSETGREIIIKEKQLCLLSNWNRVYPMRRRKT